MVINSLKNLVDESLNDYFLKKEKTYSSILHEAMSYSLNTGGKRVRAILFLLAYSIYKKDYKKVLDIALGIEMIHTYSLIHDDLPCMDNDDLRRGKPTNHKVYGDAIATLAGDALLNEAMNIFFDFSLKNGVDSLKACKVISKASGSDGMIAGQIVDIINEGNKELSLDELNYMHTKKTGELIRASIVAGAILGGASEKDIDVLSNYGYKLGLAFQIKDDILDVTSSTEILGKDAKSDIENNKVNYISLFGVEKCKEICKGLTDECLEHLESIEGDTKELIELTILLMKRKY
ncbi:MAG: polyprenyl synthetase family protein [Clostridium perfringens]|nr:polyprenyl synthetase family protein [Clostridium perfringens]